jgi:hypothetical protein
MVLSDLKWIVSQVTWFHVCAGEICFLLPKWVGYPFWASGTLRKSPLRTARIGLSGFSGEIYGFNRVRAAKRRPAMLGNTCIQRNGMEQMSLPPEWQQLAMENGSLRVIIAELLLKNQKLRWQLSLSGCGQVQGTP